MRDHNLLSAWAWASQWVAMNPSLQSFCTFLGRTSCQDNLTIRFRNCFFETTTRPIDIDDQQTQDRNTTEGGKLFPPKPSWLCSANVGNLVLLRRFPLSDRCPPTERRTYVGEPLRRLAPDTAAMTLMQQKRFGCGRRPRHVQFISSVNARTDALNRLKLRAMRNDV